VIPDVEAVCDQVAVIDQGRLKAFGAMSSFLSAQDSERFEILFRVDARVAGKIDFDMDSSQVSGLPGEIMRVRVEGLEKARKLLELALSKPGFELISYNPVRGSLEELFGGSAVRATGGQNRTASMR
jgi:ABC-type multidrug transport system ATPase subunit